MKSVRRFLTRLSNSSTPRRNDQRLREEIEGHLAMETEANLCSGMAPEEARRQAALKLGALVPISEDYDSEQRLRFLDDLLQDVRYALRQMRRSPAFTLLTAVILTLGIGINTAIFSLVYHVLLEPLPFPKPEQLYAIWGRSNLGGNARTAASGPDFIDYQDQSNSFANVAAFIPDFTEPWTGDGEPKVVWCTGVTNDFFSVLGIHPFMGRFYAPAEYTVLNSSSVLISYRFWKSQLGGDPQVLGRVIRLGGSANTIVGVVPPLPDLFPNTDIWATLTTRPSWEFMKWRNNKFLSVIGRLKSGVTPAAAENELTAILRRAPGEASDVRVQLVTLKDDIVGPVRNQLQVILLAVALVLMVACTNVAALLLARSARRGSEMAVRLSLGAGPKRLQRQLFTEGLLLTLVACSPGILAAWLALRALPSLNVIGLPRVEGVHLNSAALLVTSAIAALTTLLFGWTPSLLFSRLDLASSLRTGRTNTGNLHSRSFSGLIVAEIACAIVLSTCAGLLLHSYWRLTRVDSGFQPSQMLKVYLRTTYYGPQGQNFWKDTLESVSKIPGVSAAAVADCTPGQSAAIATLVFSDRPNDPNHSAPAEGCWASLNFFHVTETPLLRGRVFNSGDSATSAPIAIINEQTAQRYWPGEDPIGKFVGVNYTGPGRRGGAAPRLRQIVGIVRGIKNGAPDSPTEPTIYMPYVQDETYHDLASMNLFVRTLGNPLTLAQAIRIRIHAIQPDQPVDEIQSMQDVVSRSTAARRYSLSLLSAFAGLTLLLSAIGIYAIVSWTTLQRTREFGIRMALGATRVEIMAVVFGQGLRLSLVGTAIGVCGALMMTRALAQLLFGVSPLDPASFCSAVVLLLAIALGACILPAMRSAYVDPVRALRSE